MPRLISPFPYLSPPFRTVDRVSHTSHVLTSVNAIKSITQTYYRYESTSSTMSEPRPYRSGSNSTCIDIDNDAGTFDGTSLTNTPTANTTDVGSGLGSNDSQEPLKPMEGVGRAVTNSAEPEHNGKRYLTEALAYEHLAYAWSPKKKWFLLTIVAICQTSKLCHEISLLGSTFSHFQA